MKTLFRFKKFLCYFGVISLALFGTFSLVSGLLIMATYLFNIWRILVGVAGISIGIVSIASALIIYILCIIIEIEGWQCTLEDETV